MDASVRVRKRVPSFTPRALAEAASDIVRAEGFEGLTLRPLAKRLGAPVSMLIRRYGARRDVMAAIVDAARAEDAEALLPWRRRLERLEVIGIETGADLAETLIEEFAVAHRPRALLFLEMFQATAWDSDLCEAFRPWFLDRRAIWDDLARRAGVPEAFVQIGTPFGYFVDELAFSVSLSASSAYRLLRRLCLRRAFGGLISRANAEGDIELFGALFEELELPAEARDLMEREESPGDWRERAALACATLMTERGCGALTHRAVAARADLPATTLGYRFPTHESLVAAGLEYIISHGPSTLAARQTVSLQSLIDIGPGAQVDFVRGVLAVAIAAARIPRLAPHAADLRRRRGQNVFELMKRRDLTVPGFDILSAQTLVMAGVGALAGAPLAAQPIDAPERMLSAGVAWSLSVSESVARSA